ncbi:hypothetical protein [Rhodoblastus sp.]|uniref:hypothetical protein n=1 Tax=Rhodoblastus sp. TaxID=1962975 RepID=UPI003F952B90
MRKFLLAPLFLSATLSGCNFIGAATVPASVLPPEDARRPERSLRMALFDYARYDPFRDAYTDKISTMPEDDLYRYAQSATPEHAACMRSLGWQTRPGTYFRF